MIVLSRASSPKRNRLIVCCPLARIRVRILSLLKIIGGQKSGAGIAFQIGSSRHDFDGGLTLQPRFTLFLELTMHRELLKLVEKQNKVSDFACTAVLSSIKKSNLRRNISFS
ncbi:MAG: hypothetical protein ONB44_12235 [candidate division KSB1 bacterium]|nr:hypothetical protein [candidate division KSB1 bacterium]